MPCSKSIIKSKQKTFLLIKLVNTLQGNYIYKVSESIELHFNVSLLYSTRETIKWHLQPLFARFEVKNIFKVPNTPKCIGLQLEKDIFTSTFGTIWRMLLLARTPDRLLQLVSLMSIRKNGLSMSTFYKSFVYKINIRCNEVKKICRHESTTIVLGKLKRNNIAHKAGQLQKGKRKRIAQEE